MEKFRIIKTEENGVETATIVYDDVTLVEELPIEEASILTETKKK